MDLHLFRRFASAWRAFVCLSLAVLLADPAPAWAGTSISSLITNGGRSRVIQVCVGAMILGLFILMRRWTEDGDRGQ